MTARQKLRLQLYIVPLVAAFFFYREFLAGLAVVAFFIGNLLKFTMLFFLGRPDTQVLRDAFATLYSKEVLFFVMGAAAYFLLYRFSLFMMAQFALPVTNWQDRWKAYNRLVLFSRGEHGPAIFVKDGSKISHQGELDNSDPGVALVDSSSAVALVQHDDVKSMSLPSMEEWESVRKKSPKKRKGKFIPYEPKEPETKGPGVVFTEKGQKIEDTIDLRKQTRTSDFLEVYTRNGIKVKSKVTVVFSLSDPPEKLWVGYLGGKTPDNLMILKATQDENRLTIKDGIPLDADDASEILNASHPVPASSPSDPSVPYSFDPERVKWAAFNQARDKDGKLIPWHQAPLEAAVDIFRKMMFDVPYDNFFSVNLFSLNRTQTGENKTEKTSAQLFLSDLKESFVLLAKARGLATFQFIEHLNGAPFSIDQTVSVDALRQQTPVTLKKEKFNYFRHMGIVVKNASFSDVLACDSKVQDRMLEAWKAKMEREIAVFNAEYELEAIRVRNRNRALAQEEMTHLLSGIFQSTPHFDEAIALRVLQALETSVADREMSSADLQEILKSIHDWLLADQQAEDGSSQKPPQK